MPARALCYLGTDTSFAFVYVSERYTASEIQAMADRLETTAAMYGNLIETVQMGAVDDPDKNRQAFAVMPTPAVEESILEQLVLSLVEGDVLARVTTNPEEIKKAQSLLAKALKSAT